MATLTLIDVAGIQPFVFGSNRLQQNIGGSYLVKAALSDWLKPLCSPDGLLFSGGGKALIQSDTLEQAKTIVEKLSQRLILEAPGLTPFCAHVEWDGSDRTFNDRYDETQRLLSQNKNGHWPEPEFDGLGVVVGAAPNDALAIQFDEKKGEWVSRTGEARRRAAAPATEQLRALFQSDVPPHYEWTLEMDELGRTRGERSLLGVIHFDGNSMGKRFEKASKQGWRALKTLSEQVEEAGRSTLKGVVKWVIDQLPHLEESLNLENKLPLRPILFGGDDITLVCEGRIALDLAAKLLEFWEEQNLGLPTHACAGVALVPVKFPFYRAYQLSEDCCKQAKNWLRDKKLDASALHWRIQSGGALDESESKADPFTAKPYLLKQNSSFPERHWAWFRKMVEDWANLRNEDEDNALRTQLKSFGEALRAGQGREFLDRIQVVHAHKWKGLPEPPERPTRDGFFDQHTPYLDALELMDRVVPGLSLAEKVG